MNAPEFLEQLVAQQPQLGPNPPRIIAWKEKDETVIVVLEDGRKLTFRKLDPGMRKRDFTAGDFREHVGKDKAPKKKD
jgi:hypothetical protein